MSILLTSVPTPSSSASQSHGSLLILNPFTGHILQSTLDSSSSSASTSTLSSASSSNNNANTNTNTSLQSQQYRLPNINTFPTIRTNGVTLEPVILGGDHMIVYTRPNGGNANSNDSGNCHGNSNEKTGRLHLLPHPSPSPSSTSSFSQNKQQTYTYTTPPPKHIQSLTLSPSNLYLLGGTNKGVCIWEVTTGKLIRFLSGGHYRGVTVVAFLGVPDDGNSSGTTSGVSRGKQGGEVLITGGGEGSINFWDFLDVVSYSSLLPTSSSSSSPSGGGGVEPLLSKSIHTLPITTIKALKGNVVLSCCEGGGVVLIHSVSGLYNNGGNSSSSSSREDVRSNRKTTSLHLIRRIDVTQSPSQSLSSSSSTSSQLTHLTVSPSTSNDLRVYIGLKSGTVRIYDLNDHSRTKSREGTRVVKSGKKGGNVSGMYSASPAAASGSSVSVSGISMGMGMNDSDDNIDVACGFELSIPSSTASAVTSLVVLPSPDSSSSSSNNNNMNKEDNYLLSSFQTFLALYDLRTRLVLRVIYPYGNEPSSMKVTMNISGGSNSNNRGGGKEKKSSVGCVITSMTTLNVGGDHGNNDGGNGDGDGNVVYKPLSRFVSDEGHLDLGSNDSNNSNIESANAKGNDDGEYNNSNSNDQVKSFYDNQPSSSASAAAAAIAKQDYTKLLSNFTGKATGMYANFLSEQCKANNNGSRGGGLSDVVYFDGDSEFYGGRGEVFRGAVDGVFGDMVPPPPPPPSSSMNSANESEKDEEVTNLKRKITEQQDVITRWEEVNNKLVKRIEGKSGSGSGSGSKSKSGRGRK